MVEGKKSPNWNKNDSSPILKIMTLPIAIIMIALGIMTILGGHITPGGGFQGGAMIAGAIIFCVIVYGVDGTPLKLSHRFISTLESIGALAYVLLGLAGLALTGSYASSYCNIILISGFNPCRNRSLLEHCSWTQGSCRFKCSGNCIFTI